MDFIKKVILVLNLIYLFLLTGFILQSGGLMAVLFSTFGIFLFLLPLLVGIFNSIKSLRSSGWHFSQYSVAHVFIIILPIVNVLLILLLGCRLLML